MELRILIALSQVIPLFLGALMGNMGGSWRMVAFTIAIAFLAEAALIVRAFDMDVGTKMLPSVLDKWGMRKH